MTGHEQTEKTETVTTTRPTPVSSLPSGMPIADKRVGLRKGGGAWLIVGGAAAIVAVLLFVMMTGV